MKKSICDECGKTYYVSREPAAVEGYCPKCIHTFETYYNAYAPNSRALTRIDVKEICEVFFKQVTIYNKNQAKKWRAQTLEKRLTPEGRDMGSHIDNVNQILDTMERFLRCEPKE